MTTSAPGELADRLHEALSPDSLSVPSAEYAVDGLLPSLVVAPKTIEDVARALAIANDCGAAVIPRGGGSQMALGMPPLRYDLALDLRGLDEVVEFEPADLTVTVQAGMRLRELQRRLAERGQWLPLDPPLSPDATIGGMLATNVSGPGRIAYGTARDLVIGMVVATAEGQVVKSGGRVVKNVAGYDMAKMHIGALGTLGVIVQVAFKIAPRPAAERSLVIEGGEVDALLRLAFETRDAGLPATGIVMRDDGHQPDLKLRFAGNAASVDRSCREASLLAHRFSLRVDGVESEPSTLAEAADQATERALTLRMSCRPSEIGDFLRTSRTLGGVLVSYPTAGVAFMRLDEAASETEGRIARLRAEIEASGGALVLESAPPEIKREIGVWGSARADFVLMRRLKEQMDPNAILNPGRFLGGL
jgi:glycolate oxidase FAD binding subunit